MSELLPEKALRANPSIVHRRISFMSLCSIASFLLCSCIVFAPATHAQPIDDVESSSREVTYSSGEVMQIRPEHSPNHAFFGDELNQYALPMVSRDEATEIARADALEQKLGFDLHEVLSLGEITVAAPNLYCVSLAGCWIAYFAPLGPPALCSSTTIVIDRASAKVIYRGCANDEG